MSLLDADLKYEMQEDFRGARIKVLESVARARSRGRMIEEGLEGVDFFVMNTDMQLWPRPARPQAADRGENHQWPSAGSDPTSAVQAALEDTEKILENTGSTDMVFVHRGPGWPARNRRRAVVATLAKELGALTVAVVTRPFGSKGAG